MTIPAVLPALQHRQVREAARLVQATIEGARDVVIRANAPRGIRLVPDASFPGSTTDSTVPLAAAGSSHRAGPGLFRRHGVDPGADPVNTSGVDLVWEPMPYRCGERIEESRSAHLRPA